MGVLFPAISNHCLNVVNYHPHHHSFQLKNPFKQCYMVFCLHYVGAEPFVDAIPGNAPTEADFEIFKKADLRSKKGHKLSHQLVSRSRFFNQMSTITCF